MEPEGELQPVQQMTAGDTLDTREDMPGGLSPPNTEEQMLPTSKEAESPLEMTTRDTQDTEEDMPGCLSPCETTVQVPPTRKETELSLEAYMVLQGPQENMGEPEAQGRRLPPPKPPRRNKGRVIWYSGCCPYSDWPPHLENQRQGEPGPLEPEQELQPVQQMTMGDTLDTGEDMPGGLSPPNTEEQMLPTSKETESPLEASVALLGPQNNMGALRLREGSSPLPSFLAGTRAELSEDQPQGGPGPMEPEQELQPVQQMTTGDTLDTGEVISGGLSPPNAEEQMFPTSKEAESPLEMTTGDTQDTEEDMPGCLSPCETTGQVPPTSKETEPSLEAYMALHCPQDNMGKPEAQGRRQPPPKPPCRNKGKVIWYSECCPYSDWPPHLEEQPQGEPGSKEPVTELQPVQQMTTGDTLDTGEDMPGGLSPPNTEEQMLSTSKETESPLEMTTGDTQDTEEAKPGCLSPCETTVQVPPTRKEVEPSLEAYMALQSPQENIGVPEAQGRRLPPPKPPHRNKGRVIWYSGSCPYSDWPPHLEDQPQGGPGPMEPEGELQPVQKMTMGDTLDTGEDMPGGLSPPNSEEQMFPTNKEAESPMEMNTGDMQDTEGDTPGGLSPFDTKEQIPPTSKEAQPSQEASLLGAQDYMGDPEIQGRRQPPLKPPCRNKGRVIWDPGSCPHSDLSPPLEDKPQERPGQKEPEEELQPLQQMTSGDKEDAEGGIPVGLCPCETTGKIPPIMDAEHPLKASMALLGPQDGTIKAQRRWQPPSKSPHKNNGRVMWFQAEELLRLAQDTQCPSTPLHNNQLALLRGEMWGSLEHTGWEALRGTELELCHRDSS
ncbi:uncharacterized protein LOC132540801 [Erinaceus europaeus]|uniref:Uncharacterized protein LOC132540801 n=1 Tax=Erinaceus europaeus TaxID=9365 RepID=A0ABM3Y1L9_ERIEU|nr:uncharacterized protein LOC132540801 [Erinaceus europaeus]